MSKWRVADWPGWQIRRLYNPGVYLITIDLLLVCSRSKHGYLGNMVRYAGLNMTMTGVATGHARDSTCLLGPLCVTTVLLIERPSLQETRRVQ